MNHAAESIQELLQSIEPHELMSISWTEFTGLATVVVVEQGRNRGFTEVRTETTIKTLWSEDCEALVRKMQRATSPPTFGGPS